MAGFYFLGVKCGSALHIVLLSFYLCKYSNAAMKQGIHFQPALIRFQLCHDKPPLQDRGCVEAKFQNSHDLLCQISINIYPGSLFSDRKDTFTSHYFKVYSET